MAAPNLASPTTITGKTAMLSLSSTSETSLLVNAASSSKAMRITSLFVANIDGTLSADITVRIYNSATAGTAVRIANTVGVPADATLTVLSRDTSVWLEEDTRVTVQASAANALAVVASYEEVG